MAGGDPSTAVAAFGPASCSSFAQGHVGRVVVGDGGCLGDGLSEGPERDPAALARQRPRSRSSPASQRVLELDRLGVTSDSCVPEHGHQAAALFRVGSRQAPPLRDGQLVLPAYEWARESAGEGSVRAHPCRAAGSRAPLRLPLEHERLDGLGVDRPPERGGPSAARSGFPSEPAACSRRAATLTASPTTRCCPAVGSATTTSPVLTPMRVVRRTPHPILQVVVEADEGSAHSRPPRATARNASSSRTTGRPKIGHHRVSDVLFDDATPHARGRPLSRRSSAASPRGATRCPAPRRG